MAIWSRERCSQAAVVRPQLPSLFEPSAASGRLRSELEFEPGNFFRVAAEPQRRRARRRIRRRSNHGWRTRHANRTFGTPAEFAVACEPSPTGDRRTPPSILAPSQPLVREPEPITTSSIPPERNSLARPKKLSHRLKTSFRGLPANGASPGRLPFERNQGRAGHAGIAQE